MSRSPILLWLRRDLRLADNPALAAAASSGRPVIPVVIRDAAMDRLGAAPKWRMGQAVERFGSSLNEIGSSLILRAGEPLEVLRGLVAETRATSVFWTRWYEPACVARDKAVMAALKEDGLDVKGFPGFLLHEPWQVKTGPGGPYAVFTPFWRAVRDRDPGPVLAPVSTLVSPPVWPRSEVLADWRPGAAMQRGAAVVARHSRVGEAEALARLTEFLGAKAETYAEDRNWPGRDATSGLSENLTHGEISPRLVWQRTVRAMEDGVGGAEHFLRELVWREFAWHLMWHHPGLAARNWREKWDAFPWRGDNPDAEAWRRGETGIDLVDAGMRELYATGTMHNRVRMVAASYLAKHLLTDWRVGLAWFQETLIDWDPASNAMGWQWVAGSGPDAAPYFRIFNPDSQAEKFDPERTYRDRFLNGDGASDFRDASPKSRVIARPDRPVMALARGRAAALSAYEAVRAPRP